jgi:transcriptional regulator with XRE-family HTH domain
MLLRRSIGSALRRARQRQGRTLREVAHTARVSMPYLSEVERGRKEVSSEILAAICVALGLRLIELLDEVREDLAVITGEPDNPAGTVTAPQINGPRLATPGRSTPGFATPGLATPGLATPRLPASGFVAPGFVAPGADAPRIAVPRIAAPQVPTQRRRPGTPGPASPVASVTRYCRSRDGRRQRRVTTRTTGGSRRHLRHAPVRTFRDLSIVELQAAETPSGMWFPLTGTGVRLTSGVTASGLSTPGWGTRSSW